MCMVIKHDRTVTLWVIQRDMLEISLKVRQIPLETFLAMEREKINRVFN